MNFINRVRVFDNIVIEVKTDLPEYYYFLLFMYYMIYYYLLINYFGYDNYYIKNVTLCLLQV
jgi:hypothetical protein